MGNTLAKETGVMYKINNAHTELLISDVINKLLLLSVSKIVKCSE